VGVEGECGNIATSLALIAHEGYGDRSRSSAARSLCPLPDCVLRTSNSLDKQPTAILPTVHYGTGQRFSVIPIPSARLRAGNAILKTVAAS
jgi:hypothetical protein